MYVDKLHEVIKERIEAHFNGMKEFVEKEKADEVKNTEEKKSVSEGDADTQLPDVEVIRLAGTRGVIAFKP